MHKVTILPCSEDWPLLAHDSLALVMIALTFRGHHSHSSGNLLCLAGPVPACSRSAVRGPGEQTEAGRPGALPQGTDFPCRQTWTHYANQTQQGGPGGGQRGILFSDESSRRPSVRRVSPLFYRVSVRGKERGGVEFGKRRN